MSRACDTLKLPLAPDFACEGPCPFTTLPADPRFLKGEELRPFITALATSLAGLALCSSSVRAERYLLACDSGLDRIALLSAFDGSVVNANFIVDGAGVNFDFQTPKDVIRVGDEIWVSDQVSDAIFRFSLGGKWQSTISGGLDNIRGFDLIGSTVYVTNRGTANGAPGPAIVRMSTSGTILGNIPLPAGDTNAHDIIADGAGFLVSDIDSDDINRFTDAGFVSKLVDSTANSPINVPGQLGRLANGDLLIAGASSPLGLFNFTAAGAFVTRYSTGSGPNGVALLGNGTYAYSRQDGFHVLDPATGLSTSVLSGAGLQGQFMTIVELPEPTSACVFGCVAASVLRRRRR